MIRKVLYIGCTISPIPTQGKGTREDSPAISSIPSPWMGRAEVRDGKFVLIVWYDKIVRYILSFAHRGRKGPKLRIRKKDLSSYLGL
jgi:hypothetical protein